MNMTTLITAYKTALNNDTALAAWCTTNFSAVQDVRVSIDKRDPATLAAPLIILAPHSELDAADGMTYTIAASCGLQDEGLLATGLAKVTELQGVSHLDTFRNTVKATMKAATLDAGYYFGDISTDYEAVDYFPNFVAVMLFPVHYKARKMRGRYS